jgi:hypothetical protein
LIIIASTLLIAKDTDIESKIYITIFHAIYPNKNNIKVYTNDNSKKNFLKNIYQVRLVNNPKDADLLLLYKAIDIDIKNIYGVIFATTYHLLKDYKDVAIGGFYWQKGRPNILFLKQNLKKEKISLPQNIQKYIEEEL